MANFDGQPQLTEMDALIAYLQMLGTLVDFLDLHPGYKPLTEGFDMDTYSFLRELADSWVLLAMMIFYVIACLWSFRPGAAPANEEAASIPFRNDGQIDPTSNEVEAK